MDNKVLMACRVIDRFMDYQLAFHEFKSLVGLTPIDNIHECVSGVVDKLGRMTRHVKHNGRNDPKENFPDDAIESFAGCLAYLDLIFVSFNLDDKDARRGFMTELMKAVEQHSKKD